MSEPEAVKGARVILKFDGRKCIHSRHCVLDRPDVFVPNVKGEWIYPDRATVEELAELAHNCPSGAITFERIDGGPDESPPLVNTVRVREGGPLAVHGDLEIVGHGTCLRATLCRCGASKNKPFCDSSHVAAAFSASGEAPTRESQPLQARNGRLTITPSVDGPLRLEGSVEVCTGTGRTLDRLTKVALCRCGHSSNKPFCDGTHKRVGFKSDS